MRREIGTNGSGGRDSLVLPMLLLRSAVVLAFAGLAVGFWHLQIAQHEKYRQQAENNHQRTIALSAPRGVVLDRGGRPLVENRYSLNISLVREQVEDIEASIALLADLSGVLVSDLWSVVERHRRDPAYSPIVLIRDASPRQIAAFEAHKLELPGLIVQHLPTRYYQNGEVAAHVFGYIGEVSEGQLETADFQNIRSGTLVGQSGIEQMYNQFLIGTDGERRVVVDSIGREIEELGEVASLVGQQLLLTLDFDLQQATEDAFALEGFNGSAVVLDPRSGEILALVSVPAYDPNAFALGIDQATWTSLNEDPLRPLNSRALQNRYPPGSIFKIVMAVAALEEGIVTADYRVSCRAGGNFYGRFWACPHGPHGSVDMREALEKSCNTYFYKLGELMEIDDIHKWATALGLGELSGIDLPYEVQGLMPSRAWKREARNDAWHAGETISVAIGQGAVTVTPISMAVMMATVANGGTRITPHLLKAVNFDGTGFTPYPPPAPRSMVSLSPTTLNVVTDGLWYVVNRAGTGGRARIEGRDVIGKTGTAQVISFAGREAAGDTDRDLRAHGWFVFAAPAGAPEIAGVVFGEHAEHGSWTAPIAKHVMETYFAKQEGRPLPVLPLPARPPMVTPVLVTIP